MEKIENQIMAERRKRKRYKLIFDIIVVDLSTEEEIGRVVNISTHGFLLSSSREFDREIFPNLALLLPKESELEEDIIFEAHACWTKPDANPMYTLTGFKVEGNLQEYSACAEILIEKFSLVDEQ